MWPPRFTPPANVALTVVPGIVNLTVKPGTGLLLESFAVATSGCAKPDPTTADCGVPPVAVSVVPVRDTMVSA